MNFTTSHVHTLRESTRHLVRTFEKACPSLEALGQRELPMAFVPLGMLYLARRMQYPPGCYTL